MNTLFYGDNLEVLKEHIADESIDLIYLDPPFNSKADYNILFKATNGTDSQSQITAFEDTWHWTEETERTFSEIVEKAPGEVVNMMKALRDFIHENDMMAYLTMMTIRLLELKRVLKSTGSIFLHCDPTASHYLKVVMDTIFGAKNFKNEIIWKRRTGSFSYVHKSRKLGVCTDSIFLYSKSKNSKFYPQYTFDAQGYQDYVDKFFKHKDEHGRKFRIDNLANPATRPNLIYEYKGYKPPKNGWAISLEKMKKWDEEGRLYFPKDKNGRIQRKRFLDESKGKPVQSLWDDIKPISSHSKERLDYQTQKPEMLLERILEMASDEGDIILDPFCGCGTTISVAQKLKREWVGIDITHLAINLIKDRLKQTFSISPGIDFQVIGEPTSLDGARNLAAQNRYQFQWWITGCIGARPYKGKIRGPDSGIDAIDYFQFKDPETREIRTEKIIISVKSGHVNVAQIRDLKAVVEREKAVMGIFITLEPNKKTMEEEAVKAGFYLYPLTKKNYRKIQVLTVEEIMQGKKIDVPETGRVEHTKKAEQYDGKQKKLF